MDFYTNMALLLKGFGQRIGLDLSELDLSDDYFGLAVNKSKVLDIILLPQRLGCVFHMAFQRPAACLQTDDPAELSHRLAFLLGANVMLLGAAGAALGYEEESGTVSLSMNYDLPEVVNELALETFVSRIETFLDTFDRWSQYVEQEPSVSVDLHSMLNV
ncbi:MAG TPA: type III secretion system chaperone [Candidatus Avidesulfovibrio excrementigallinarum]|nr:type III secretion system chaperone [Candidatus Avidesulfovibrio excrementigallinarum]